MTGFFGTKKWKRLSHIIYSVGAAIVILGALFKLNHYSFGPFTGETMLLVGLGTEAIIFFISAFETPHKEYDWSLVYPELVGLEAGSARPKLQTNTDGFAQLNELFASANIDSGVMEKLGAGINKLEVTASRLNDMSDASIATNNYVQSMNTATEAVKSLAENHNLNLESYKKMSETFNTSISKMEENSGEYNNQMNSFNKNLSSLNSMYEIQLKATKERLDNQERVGKGMNDVMENLSVSLENSKKFKEQSDELAQNLTALNKVYGNMLSAMNVSK
ncbi:protein involved in gliding motility GldL [Balneicella halophila]|uniref:Protein involved in gliding motility GldL n=1 Tax=Balneicella halophila TaxID=1537566 RepID=A0A7L4UQQ9_BALHA|nr:gliding motility protein GldL [Balneicella halophila]PVX52106.1 protein involved in gliding motility GldL [Balneicella halophila]